MGKSLGSFLRSSADVQADLQDIQARLDQLKQRTDREIAPRLPGPKGALASNRELLHSMSPQFAENQATLDTLIDDAEDDLSRIRGEFDVVAETSFDSATVERIFKKLRSVGCIAGGPATNYRQFQNNLKDLQEKIEDILRRLPHFTDASDNDGSGVDGGNPVLVISAGSPERESPAAGVPAVFVVHGHNHGIKEAVARATTQMTGLQALILHEQANKGRTIIEKFEQTAAEACFAVIVMTADDEGRACADASADLQSRARQNVVLELGYFIGRLGRSRVAVLHEEGVEVPSDILGVMYTPIDDGGLWKYELGKELKAAGINADLNSV